MGVGMNRSTQQANIATSETQNAMVPFQVGSNLYDEQFFQDTATVSGSSQEFVHNIVPGGFLRGVFLKVRSTGGVGGTATPDNPWSLLRSISIENIDGSPILYPMSGYTYFLINKYCRPWEGDPSNNSAFSAGSNPGFDIFIFPEVRDTAGALANTDARAQYRIRYTIGTTTDILTGATTPPTVTVTGSMFAWAQTDTQDLHGNPIQPVPDGLALAHISRHQILTMNGSGATNTFQSTNTGNEIRCSLLVTRDGTGARIDALTDPIRVRLDNRSLQVSTTASLFGAMQQMYPFILTAARPRETGVYVFPRFRRPGDLYNDYWLGTSNATYLIYESQVSTSTNMPGTAEIITDEIIPVAPVPPELEGV